MFDAYATLASSFGFALLTCTLRGFYLIFLSDIAPHATRPSSEGGSEPVPLCNVVVNV